MAAIFLKNPKKVENESSSHLSNGQSSTQDNDPHRIFEVWAFRISLFSPVVCIKSTFNWRVNHEQNINTTFMLTTCFCPNDYTWLEKSCTMQYQTDDDLLLLLKALSMTLNSIIGTLICLTIFSIKLMFVWSMWIKVC